MAINQEIISTSWEGQQKSYIEAGLKTLLQRMLEVLESPLAANSVGSNQLTQELRDVINSIGSKVPNTRTVNNKELSSNIAIGPDDIMVGNQTLADKLDDMDDAIGQGGDTSGLASRITALETSLNRLTGTEDTTQIIDTFNEVIDFLASVNNDETLLGKLQQLQTQINSKANDNAVVKGIKANGASETLPVDQNGIVELPPAGSTISPATAAPLEDGTAGVGLSAKYAREDHVHPHDSTKANASDVYTKTQTDTLLAGKQNTLTFDDAPTAGSNNPVKSGGIKTAIDNVTPTIDANGKWVIGGVTTDKDAQGPRGNTVLVNENAQGIQALIVNNVSDGGETDILSAEMGKVIRQNIMRIFNALGTYAFPEGKPILNWGSTVINHSINVNGVTGGLTISDVEVDGVSVGSLPAQVVEGKSLSLKLNLPTGMYVFDGVAITMGGVNITNNTGVWDESTGTIYIASVTDDISITATAVDTINNYAQQSHLMFQLDGLSTGNVQDKWTDLKGGIEFTNHGATKVATGWDFANSAYMDSANAMSGMDYIDGTLEVCFTSRLTGQQYFIFTAGGSDLIMCFVPNSPATGYANSDIYIARSVGDNDAKGVLLASGANVDNGIGKKIVSINLANAVLNGKAKSFFKTFFSKDDVSLIGCRQKNGTRERFFDGVIHAIRYYDTQLTAAEILANQRLDNERFNLGLTINS